MKRLIMDDLLKWKNSKRRKPLLLKGARQVGKTWLLKDFGNNHYENVAYINFEENEEYKQFFKTTKNPDRILRDLALSSAQKIVPGKTLIIFDEIQSCPDALNSLKYFYENKPEQHVACAGSLLGVSLSGSKGFPVGKVDFMDINPLSFSEFLLADKSENLFEYLNSIDEITQIPDAFFNPLSEKLKTYFVTGGMPEPIQFWTEDQDVEGMEKALGNILGAYEKDFSKYPDKSEYPKISMLWSSISSQLSKENKKFLYRVVKNGARAREYEDALQWLVNAGLIHKIFRSSSPGVPLTAYDDITAFKIYLLDVGLLRRLAHLSPSTFAKGNRLFTELKGSLTENYILEALISQYDLTPRYWSMVNPSYEVDFLIQSEDMIIPIEVKAETNIRSKSLRKYKEKYRDKVKLRVRFSLANLKLDDDLLNIPLFMADYTDKVIKLALNQIESN